MEVSRQALGYKQSERIQKKTGVAVLSEARREIANEKKYKFGTAFCERHISFKMKGREER